MNRSQRRNRKERKRRDRRQPKPSQGNGNKPLQRLITDPSREAVSTLRGYRYQILRTVYSWLELEKGNLLFVEGAEDFDRVSSTGATAVQVKDTKSSGNLTLRSADVVDAVSNYWTHKSNNPGRRIQFHFLTTASVGQEKGAPFGKDSGIDLWERARTSRSERDRLSASEKIRQFLIDEKRVENNVLSFLNSSSSEETWQELVANMAWHTALPGGEEVETAIRQKLERMFLQRNISPRLVDGMLARLEQYVFATAGKDEERVLSVEDLDGQIEDVTSIAVPNATLLQLNELLQSLNSATLQFVSGSTATLAVQGNVSRVGIPPPLPSVLMPREGVLAELRSLGETHRLLNIYGTTGTGKSTQAAMLAASGGEWAWVSCRDLEETHLRRSFSDLGSWLDRDHDRRCLVLDDIDFTRHGRLLEELLPPLSFAVKQRRGLIVTTSQKQLPSRLKNWLGVNECVAFAMPMLDELEIDNYLNSSGCADDEIRRALATIVWLKTAGHPQLVSAHVSSLSQKGFPKSSASDVLGTPHEIKEVRNEARVFVARELPAEQKELLYRLSLLIGTFPKDKAVLIANIPQALQHPGDVFDHLVGPWLERATSAEYRLSPLIQGAGIEANGTDWAKSMHASVAIAWARSSQHTPWSIASVLWHSVMGGSGVGIVWVSRGLISAGEEVWKAIAEADAVFVHLYVGKGQTFPGWNPGEVFCARMIQLNLAFRSRPALCEKLLDRIDEELPHKSEDRMVRMMRQMLLGLVVARSDLPLDVSKLASRFLQFIELTDQMPEEIDGIRLKPENAPDFLGEDGPQDPANIFAATMIQRTKTIEELDTLIDVVDDLLPPLRERCLRLFRVDSDMSRQLADSVWLTEFRSEKPNWAEVVNKLMRLYEKAEKWGEANLALGVASVLGRTLHENLKQTDGALRVLSDASMKFGSVPMVVDAKAKILMQTDHLSEALSLWLSVFDDWERDRGANPVAIGLAMRNAAISAAKLGNWNQAHQIFARATTASARAMKSTFHIGLSADAGYAAFRASNYDASARYFAKALEALEGVPNTTDDIKNYYLHKIVGHVLTWASASIKREGSDLAEPSVGCCSDTDPPENILQINPTPIDFSWAHLLSIAERGGTLPANLVEKIPRLRNSPHFGARMYVAEHDMNRAIDKGPCNSLPEKIGEYVYGLLCFRQQCETGVNPWDASTEALSVGPTISSSEPEFWYVFLVQGLFASIARHEEVRGILNDWRNSADAVGAPPQVKEFIESVIKGMDDSHAGVLSVILRGDGTWTRLSAAATFLSGRNLDPVALVRTNMMLITLYDTAWNKYFQRYVSEALTVAWLGVCDSPFLLRTPRLTVPAIEEACRSGLSDWRRVANLLVTGSEAAGLGLPERTRDIIQRIRNQ